MKREVIEAAKKLRNEIQLENIYDLNLKDDFDNEDARSVKILLASLNYEKNRELANDILLNLMEGASIENLFLIIQKINFFTMSSIEKVSEYVFIPELRPLIDKKFISENISYDKGFIYSIEELLQSENEIQRIKNLLATINTDNFKFSRQSLINLPYYSYFDLMPTLNEKGIHNYYKLTNGDLLKNGWLTGSISDESEYLRIAFFETIEDIEKIFEFLKYNQFINDINILKRLLKSLKVKLNNFKLNLGQNYDDSENNFNKILDRLTNDFAIKMCKSNILSRRYFGACLIQIIMEYNKNEKLIDLATQLSFDKAHEIRELFSNHNLISNQSFIELIENILSDKNNLVSSAVSQLKHSDPKILFNILKLSNYKK